MFNSKRASELDGIELMVFLSKFSELEIAAEKLESDEGRYWHIHALWRLRARHNNTFLI